MNRNDGFDPIHESNIVVGNTYYFKNRFGAGYVIARESNMRGWVVELQKDSSFKSALMKTMKPGDMMTVPPGNGNFYEPQV